MEDTFWDGEFEDLEWLSVRESRTWVRLLDREPGPRPDASRSGQRPPQRPSPPPTAVDCFLGRWSAP